VPNKIILFVTRNYPPTFGGMEKYSYDLYHCLKPSINIELLANSKGKLNIPFFIIRVLFHLIKNRNIYTSIHFGDGVLAPIALVAKGITDAKITITIHGLDITYDNIIYQKIIPACVSMLETVICVSHYSIEQCVKRGIKRERCVFIPNGINFGDEQMDVTTRNEIEKKYGLEIAGKKVLFSVCRLIKRKGIVWFISNVMPKLSDNYIYIVAGDGPEKENILKTIMSCGLQDKIFMIGRICERDKLALYQYAALFIMPNITIQGDAEGFGITLIESASHGLPSIASDIEGIPDAVLHGQTGTLVAERDSLAFVGAIESGEFDRDKVKLLTSSYFDWSILKDRYLNIFEY